MPSLIDLTGAVFGRLTVIKRFGTSKYGQLVWLCRCECGNEATVKSSYLRYGDTKSCGCLIGKGRKKILHGHTRNGMGTRAYRIWHGLRVRCLDKNSKDYKHYGGRGITLDPRWNRFENFLVDMGEPPEGMTIERIDNNGHYCKQNCKWATQKEQHRNTRWNHVLSHNGKSQCISAWAEEIGINHRTIHERLKRGWSIESALLSPVRELAQDWRNV